MVKKQIFVSYCHKNKEVVHKVASRLKEKYPIWLDIYNLKPGDNKDKEITDGVTDSCLFICFISNFYCSSEACTDEFYLAKKLKKIIFPIMLERSGSNGIELTISKLNTFYAFKEDETFDPWNEDLYQKLLETIINITEEKNKIPL
jgi:hypothetical protein